MPDLVFEESSSTWMFLSLEKDFQATWIIPGLPTLCFLNYWLVAIPTVPFLEQPRTTTSEPCPPSHTITSSAKPQSYLRVSPSTYQLRSSQCAVPLLSHPLLADQTPLPSKTDFVILLHSPSWTLYILTMSTYHAVVFWFQLHFPLPARCKIKPLVKLHRSPDCFLHVGQNNP
ncbi:hypothetical protein ILYODFUR_031359 [Ilyodon furcidens]|uniref:Uncharacterized protein n=1 Tax=Ilyodon furcidens TaxID=33524 RepID=A0ABV0UWR9_9TELE